MSTPVFQSDGRLLTTLVDGVADTSTTSLNLFGLGTDPFVEGLNENFVRLLETGAAPVAPANPMAGQQWWDTGERALKLHDGSEWIDVFAAVRAAADNANTAVDQVKWSFFNDLPTLVQEAFDDNSAIRGLNQRIADIDLNAASIEAQAFRVNDLWAELESATYLDGVALGTVILDQKQQRIDGDRALANTIAIIGAVSGGGTSFQLNMGTVYAAPGVTLAQYVSQISSQNGNAIALVTAEQNTRIAQDGIIANNVVIVGAQANNAITLVNAETTARIANNVAINGTLTTLGSQIVGANAASTAAVAQEAATRASADSAEANARVSLAASVNTNNSTVWAALTTEQSVRATADGTYTTNFGLQGGRNAGNTAWVFNESTTQVGSRGTFASILNGIQGQSDAANAAIANETTLRTNADSAEVVQRQQVQTNLNTVNGTLSGLISTETTNRTNADGVFTQNFAFMGARNAGQTGWALNQTTVELGSFGTIVNVLNGIYAGIAGANAGVSAETTARINADNAEATARQSVQANLNGANTAISTETTARINGDNTLAGQYSTLSTTVGGHTASISSQASSIGGLQAQWVLNVQSGYGVTGMSLGSGAGGTYFDIYSGNFRLLNGPGSSPLNPFSVSGTNINLTGNVRVDGSLNVNGNSIQTGNVADNAITRLVATSWDSGVQTGGSGGVVIGIGTSSPPVTVTSLSISTAGGPVDVRATLDWAITGGGQGSSGWNVWLKVYRNTGGTITTIKDRSIGNVTISGGVGMLDIVDNPPAGTHTYTLEVRHVSGTYQTSYFAYYFKLMEFKK